MTVSNSDLRIDSLDVIADIAALKEEWDRTLGEDHTDFAILSEDDWAAGLGEDGARELVALEEFAEQGAGFDDWEHGAQLIHEDDFAEFAEELVTDLGYLDTVPGWIKYHIDWEEVADELKEDYSAIDFDGVTYYIR